MFSNCYVVTWFSYIVNFLMSLDLMYEIQDCNYFGFVLRLSRG